MISPSDLRTIARARIKDAEALLRAGRYDGAVYLCGYAVEIALKARICKTLRWQGFPETCSEFSDKKSLQTHKLEILLQFAGQETRIKNPPFGPHWSVVSTWSPEDRYRLTGAVTQAQATTMIQSARVLLKALLPR
jgi:hypothetical protein